MALHPKLNLLGLHRSVDLERYCKDTLGYKRLAVSRKRLSERLNRELNYVPIPDSEDAVISAIHWSISQATARRRKVDRSWYFLPHRQVIKTIFRKVYLKDIPVESIVYKFKIGHKQNVRLDTGECVTYLDNIDFNDVPGISLV